MVPSKSRRAEAGVTAALDLSKHQAVFVGGNDEHPASSVDAAVAYLDLVRSEPVDAGNNPSLKVEVVVAQQEARAFEVRGYTVDRHISVP